MKKQDLINACATPIAMADKQPIAFTISEVIDCVMKEYEKKQICEGCGKEIHTSPYCDNCNRLWES